MIRDRKVERRLAALIDAAQSLANVSGYIHEYYTFHPSEKASLKAAISAVRKEILSAKKVLP